MNLIRPMLGWLSSCLFLKPPLWAESYWWLGRFVSFDSLMATMTTSSQDVWNCLDSAELPCILRHLWTAVFSVRFSGWCPANWRGLVVWCCFDKRKVQAGRRHFRWRFLDFWFSSLGPRIKPSTHQPIDVDFLEGDPAVWLTGPAPAPADPERQAPLRIIPGEWQMWIVPKTCSYSAIRFPQKWTCPTFPCLIREDSFHERRESWLIVLFTYCSPFFCLAVFHKKGPGDSLGLKLSKATNKWRLCRK